ncbi:MAG: hypothetical protein AABZ60_06290, partial [Planctomycetota bacterium]
MKKSCFFEIFFLCCVYFFDTAYVQEKAPSETPCDPEFLTSQIVLRERESFVIPFRLSSPASQDIVFPIEIQSVSENAIQILKEPKILSGETVGFLRVVALKPASVVLRFQ